MPHASRIRFHPRDHRRLPQAVIVALALAVLVARPGMAAEPPLSAFSVPYPTGGGAVSLAMGDLNGDGKQDVVTANNQAGTISVLLSEGDGSLQSPIDYLSGGAPFSVSTVDFNSDGLADIVVRRHGPNATLLTVLLSNGDGTLRRASEFTDIGWQTGDVDGDGRLDLLAVNGTAVTLRRGVGDGTFGPETSSQLDRGVALCTVADLNRDAREDLVVRFSVTDPDDNEYSESFLQVMLGNGDGSFTPGAVVLTTSFSRYDGGDGIQGAIAGDVSGDGIPDLACSLYYSCHDIGCVDFPHGRTMFGNGDGTFRDAAGSVASPSMIIDVDGNGVADVVGGERVGLNTVVASWHPDGSPWSNVVAGVYSAPVTFGDLNGDGRPDLATTWGSSVFVAIGHGDLTFGSGSESLLSFSPAAVASGDLNGDDRIDLVGVYGMDDNGGERRVGVLLDAGDGRWTTSGPFEVGYLPQNVALGDLNGDGRLDLAVTNENDGSVLMGDGNGGFGPRIALPAIARGKIAIADLNVDGYGDLVVGGGAHFAVLLGHGDGTFDLSFSGSFGFTAIEIRDFNQDGRLDLALGRLGGVSVMLGYGDGYFAPGTGINTGQTPNALAMGDLNRDGVVDLVASNRGSVSVLLGDGRGGFTQGAQLPLDVGRAAIGDLNGDGALDLALPTGDRTIAVLPGFNDGTFGTPTLFGTSGLHTIWAGIGYRDGDDRPDLTVMSGGFFDCDYDCDNPYYGGGAYVSVLRGSGSFPPEYLFPAPIAKFVGATVVSPDTIVLGQTFTARFSVVNDGRPTDNGLISVSFPSFTDPADGQWVSSTASGDAPGYVEVAAGSALSDTACNTMSASCLTTEYRDNDWMVSGFETNTLPLTIQPRTSGPFYFYVRSTMHDPGGGPCAFVNGLPASGQPGFTDQQGYAVKRYSVIVRPAPMLPGPVFTSAVNVTGDSLGLGESFSISLSAQNNGAASDDGRIVVGFPSLTSPADSQFVSYVKSPDTYAGDSPGYLEFPAGAIVSDSLCQSLAASYLEVEYRDSDWPWLGTEFNRFSLTVTPRAVGTFVFEVRSTMHAEGAPCGNVNAVPSGGAGGFTDQEGWSVRRFAITVLPPRPRPSFTASVVASPTAIATLGLPFTLTATVTNLGSDTDDGRIVVSFPNFTAPSDTQWVSAAAGSDDSPGYREWPSGSVLPLPNCSTIVSNYLSVEYADDAWSGAGAETNQLSLAITPRALGTFPIYVRSSMRWSPRGACAYVDSIPANAGQGTDQQGRRVGVIWVQVVSPPVFAAAVSGIPTSLSLGETFTLTAVVRNDGGSSDDARISVGFPSLTNPADVWVEPGSVNDAPGLLTYAPGATIRDSTCHPVTADHVVAEYADSSWTTGEANTLMLTVQPQERGTFYVCIRSTVHDFGAACRYLNSIPPGGVVVTDQQGWSVRVFAIAVSGPGDSLPPPSTAWERIPVSPGPAPAARGGATAIYQPGQHAMVLYGGEGSTDYFSDVWSLSLGAGSGWSGIAPGGPKPVRRILHSMILSPTDNQIVIFGGYYEVFLNDVSAMTLSPPPWWFPNPGHGTPPSVRGGHAAVYDPVRNRMLVIGGFGDAMMNDVWECAPPASGTWRQLTPAGDAMPPRLQGAAIYDPVRDRVLIFGGDGGPFFNDVWALNLSNGPAWEEIHPTGNPPSPRREQTAIYDPVGDRMIVYGGFDISRNRRGDVWALNLSGTPSWSLLVSSTPSPASRSGHVAVYDEALKRMVMFGGQIGTSQYSSEVWALNLDTTTPVAISLAATEVQSDHVRITWSAEGAANLKATVERSEGASGEWAAIGNATTAGSDRLVFEDRTVVAGMRYGYRLVIAENGSPTISEPVWVTVPVPAILSLTGASPNPSPGAVAVRFSLPGNDAAMLELFDLKGRRIAAREVGSLGPGEHLVPLSERLNLAAGVYLVRLTQGRRTLTAKACVVK